MSNSCLPLRPLAPEPASAAFEMPPVLRVADGAPRRVGVEIEFMRLGAARAARALATAFGGTVVEEDPHAFRVPGTALGGLAVELDLRHAHPQRHADTLPLRLGARGAVLLGRLLRPVVPCELITEPLALHRLPEIDGLVAALGRAGARAAGVLPVETPGLHFNVDVPRLDAATLATHLKAFLLLEPWLRRAGVGGRRGGAGRFPDDYLRLVVDPGYRPDLVRFADDYLAANPSRNRGLDLLPVLLHIDEPRVRALLPHEKIGRRPAFHYRLARARIGEEGWSVAADWNRWVAVERLAADASMLAGLGRARLGFRGGEDDWGRQVEAAVTSSQACTAR
ncbi:amidoligase family protein [Arenibaculum sp.]|jgi:hypothetical protein|uniref:amidoligase family protein n=1 Tax=Arenibaculum sp. TaxID=2865862 RepID=UPI002E0D598B|nr:amidoligase family protein [Arenibaculum sp.]